MNNIVNGPPSTNDAEIKSFAVNLAMKFYQNWVGKQIYIGDVTDSLRQMVEHKLKKEGWVKSRNEYGQD